MLSGATIENHVAGDAIPFFEGPEVVAHAIAIGSDGSNRLDHQPGAVVAVGRINIGAPTVTFFEAAHEIDPGFVGAIGVEEVGDGHAFGGGSGVLDEAVLLEAIKAEELGFHAGGAELAGAMSDILRLAVEEDGVDVGGANGLDLYREIGVAGFEVQVLHRRHAESTDIIGEMHDPDAAGSAVLAENGDALASAFLDGEQGESEALLAVVGEDPGQPGDLGLGQGRVGIRGIDHVGLDLERHAQGDVGGVAVDGSEKAEDLVVLEIDGDIGGAAPLRGVLLVDDFEGELIGLAGGFLFFESEQDALFGAFTARALGPKRLD